MVIRRIMGEGISEAIELVKTTFLEYEAPDYSYEGFHTFMECMNDQSFINSLQIYGAFNDKELRGVVATRNNGSHISLLFVSGSYHRMGIGRKLFEKVLEMSESEKITVNSSPYAVNVYHKLGFTDTNTEQVVTGIRFVPMVFIMDGMNNGGIST